MSKKHSVEELLNEINLVKGEITDMIIITINNKNEIRLSNTEGEIDKHIKMLRVIEEHLIIKKGVLKNE